MKTIKLALSGIFVFNCGFAIGVYHSHRMHMKTLREVCQRMREEESNRSTDRDANNLNGGHGNKANC